MPFEEYVKQRIVKKQAPDVSRAEYLAAESERNYNALLEFCDKVPITDENASTFVKNSYDVIMLLVRARMLLAGFNAAGQGAHEAEVAYLKAIGFGDIDVNFADQLRYFRNHSIYYGESADSEYAEKIVAFAKKMYPKLRKLV
jgi:hypothetical protein